MDRYLRVERSWNESTIEDNEIRITAQGLICNYVSYGSSLLQVHDQTLSRIKSNIELMVATNGGNGVVVIPHSMGVLYFLHFMKWVEAPPPMGGGGGPNWCENHIKAVMNIGGPFLGVPKAVAGLFTSEAKDVAVAR
ncbi:Phospholipid:diacylglycerol acyltransferase 1 [Zea mays]|uniref:Phospholipid:diacylglycerol acyltransferase 1 n=1 Tax=Zea mays TaxID=4577 RepID=A0A3L6E461_MAIZE|nr:Phospholipid:diacylglycerol acyltransferase 1 [Zea mays]